ncbi:3-carboxy-cis,cis-muconate cycloisomerase [Rhodovibrionaceae bacterium A322]
MTLSLFDSPLYGALFSDPKTRHFDDGASLQALMQFEGALARAEGRLGVIPAEAARRIEEVCNNLDLDPAALAPATARAGNPVPALVKVLQEAVGGQEAQYVHWGATTQDVIDTGLVLRLRSFLNELETELARCIDVLAAKAEAERGQVMVARTRSQQAVPTSFALKIADWLAPLLRHRARLQELKPRLFVLQLGGAAGTLSALEDRGLEVAEALAEELDLTCPAMPWHSQRDGLAELAGWLSLLSGSLGKMATDLILLGQSEVAEVSAGEGGGSSTMPQKANPVSAEMMLSFARFNAGLLGQLHQSLLHQQERDGAAWSQEWLLLPQMAVATAASLRHGLVLAESLTANPQAMARNLAASNGLVMAEAAAFALARHLPKPKAQALLKAACRTALEEQRPLQDVLAEQVDLPLDWPAVFDPAGYLGSADAFVSRVLKDV